MPANKERHAMRVRFPLPHTNGEGGFLSKAALVWLMAVSRILFSPRTLAREATTIYLTPAEAGVSCWAGCDYYPETSACAGRPGLPFLLFCLAPQRVYRAPLLALGAVGSYPAFSPLPQPCGRGGLSFCDTFRRTVLSFHAPPFSRGMLPCGVRTFLSQAHRGALESAVRHQRET